MIKIQVLLRATVAAALLATLSAPRFALAAETDDGSTSGTLRLPKAGEAREISMEEIGKLLDGHGRDLLVVNFWATWCAPCIQELPYFIEASKAYEEKGVLFVGLSADLLAGWRETVPPFLKERKVPYPNFVLRVDANEMISRFSDAWGGELPATFYFDGKGRKLGERLGIIEKAELIADIEKHLHEARKDSGQDKGATED